MGANGPLQRFNKWSHSAYLACGVTAVCGGQLRGAPSLARSWAPAHRPEIADPRSGGNRFVQSQSTPKLSATRRKMDDSDPLDEFPFSLYLLIARYAHLCRIDLRTVDVWVLF